MALVLCAGRVAPVPGDPLGQLVGEEEFVGGRENAPEGVIVQGEVSLPGLGVDEGLENAAVL